MIELRGADPAPDQRVYRRVVLLLSLEASAQLDALATFNHRDRRREALRILTAGIQAEDHVRRAVTDQPVAPTSGPRSAEARRRAAVARVRKAHGLVR